MADQHASDDIQELPPEMDYAQHNGTYRGFLGFMKWTAVTLFAVMVALYFFIEAAQPVVGTVLLLLIPIVGVAMLVMAGRRR